MSEFTVHMMWLCDVDIIEGLFSYEKRWMDNHFLGMLLFCMYLCREVD